MANIKTNGLSSKDHIFLEVTEPEPKSNGPTQNGKAKTFEVGKGVRQVCILSPDL